MHLFIYSSKGINYFLLLPNIKIKFYFLFFIFLSYLDINIDNISNITYNQMVKYVIGNHMIDPKRKAKKE